MPMTFEEELAAIRPRVTRCIELFDRYARPRWRMLIRKELFLFSRNEVLNVYRQAFGRSAKVPPVVIGPKNLVNNALKAPEFENPEHVARYEAALIAMWCRLIVSQRLYDALQRCSAAVDAGVAKLDQLVGKDWYKVTQTMPLEVAEDGTLNLCFALFGDNDNFPHGIRSLQRRRTLGLSMLKLTNEQEREHYEKVLIAEWQRRIRYRRLSAHIKVCATEGIWSLNTNPGGNWRERVDAKALACDSRGRLNLTSMVFSGPDHVPRHWNLLRLGLLVPRHLNQEDREVYTKLLIAEWQWQLAPRAKRKQKRKAGS